LDVATFQEEVTQAQQALDNFTTYYETQSDLLSERKRIAAERIAELELKLKTGRADVSALAKEFLALARTEIAIERLNYDWEIRTLSALAVTGQACELVKLCDAI